MRCAAEGNDAESASVSTLEVASVEDEDVRKPAQRAKLMSCFWLVESELPPANGVTSLMQRQALDEVEHR